ncbi:hypothetical protein H8B08_12215 [Caulobacter sp. 17J80-11]|nr:hypothetical protein [Caulobacter sp. 17J80-11]
MKEHEIDDQGLGPRPEGDPVSAENVCPECGGSGTLGSGEVCPMCGGTGRLNEKLGGGGAV